MRFFKRLDAAFYMTLTGIDRGEKIRRVQDRVIQRPFSENEFDMLWEKLKMLICPRIPPKVSKTRT